MKDAQFDAYMKYLLQTRCVASDDPALKEASK
jgi:hypothetical protein